MRTFAQLPVAIWTDTSFRKLSNDGKLAYLYLWSSHHTVSAGVYRLAPGYAAIDLGWDIERWQAAFKLIEDEGLIKSNAETEEVLISNYLTLVHPPNAPTVKVIRNQIAGVKCPRLREIAESLFNSFDQQRKTPADEESPVPPHLNTPYMKRSGT